MPLDVTPLVTSFEAHVQLRQAEGNPEIDADIEMKLSQATAVVLDYCNTTEHWRTVTATWTESTVPFAVHAAILAQLSFMFAHRGDSDVSKMVDENGLAPGVAGLLRTHRDPVIA